MNSSPVGQAKKKVLCTGVFLFFIKSHLCLGVNLHIHILITSENRLGMNI